MSSKLPVATQEVQAAYRTIRKQAPWTFPQSTVLHHCVLPLATYAPWLDDAQFLSVYQKAADHTLVDLYRCFELWELTRQIEDVEGDVLEVGVWRGGTGAILASALSKTCNKKVYLADTFRGVVKAGANDTSYRGGEHADASRAVVERLLESLSLKNVEILPGVFPDETQHHVTGRIALLHCDVDVYQSTRDVVEWCLPRLSPGSLLVFDDYGFYGCEGVTRFCNDLRSQRGFRFIHNLNGHAIFVRIASGPA
jgi:O-methyltransferase